MAVLRRLFLSSIGSGASRGKKRWDKDGLDAGVPAGSGIGFWVSVCWVLLLFPPLAMAQVSEPDKDRLGILLAMSIDELVEVEVTLATGTPVPLKLAPSVATVITAEQIRDMGARTVNEALETVPGLHVGVSTKNAMSQVYSIRGIHTSINPQVLLLMNGIPISLAFTGTRAFFNIPVSSVSRIEVVRGPGSAVYGADAFAGIINIITKDGEEIGGTEAGIRAGAFDSYDVFVQHGDVYDGWKVSVGLEYQTSNGDSDRVVDADLQRMLDGLFGTNASLTPAKLQTGYENLDMRFGVAKGDWRLRLWGELQEGGGTDGVTNVVSRGGDLDIEQVLADLSYENDDIAADLVLGGRVYFMHYRQDALIQLFPGGALLPIGVDGNIDFAAPAGLVSFPEGVWGQPVQTDKQTGLELTALYEGVEGHRIRSATGYKHLREEHEDFHNFGPGVLDVEPLPPVQSGALTDATGTEFSYAPDKTRELVYLSLQDEWSVAEDWELIAGIRYDHYSDFGDTVNPRLALVWEARDDLTAKILYGRAFRPPSFSELYTRNNPSNYGNEDLDPETIQTVEFVADYQPLRDFHLRLNLFHYDIEDLIVLVPDPGQTTKTSQNSRDQKGQGFELETEWLPTSALLLRGSLAYQDSEDKETGETVPDAPAWQAYINAHWKFMPEWSLDGQYYWIAGRERAPGDPREDVKDNDIVNLTLRRTNIMEHWELALAVRNLFDEDVREPGPPEVPDDYPMEGRSFWGELRYRF